MASEETKRTNMVKLKVHNQSGTFRLKMPKEWINLNSIESKDELDAIKSHAIIVMPKRDLTKEELEEVIRDLRLGWQARTLLNSIAY
jgi:hypothetical protein